MLLGMAAAARCRGNQLSKQAQAVARRFFSVPSNRVTMSNSSRREYYGMINSPWLIRGPTLLANMTQNLNIEFILVVDIYPFPFVSREDWSANPPISITNLASPALYVVIYHTYIPGICTEKAECIRMMQSMQNTHQTFNEWSDIGYNFAIGGEASVFEGRGWNVIGGHATTVRSEAVNIAFIGDFRTELPPAAALETTKKLIAEGVKRGHITADYKLVGHRQVADTESPGDALFNEIQTWDRFTETIETTE